MKSVKCQICSKEVPVSGRQGLKNHLKFHHDIEDAKGYYDRYFGEGACKYCGGIVRFKSLTSGYSDFCSAKCINLHRAKEGNYGNKYDSLIEKTIIPEYLDGTTKRELARKYKLKIDTITSYFKKFGVTERPLRQYLDIKNLHKKYIGEKLTLRHVARVANVSEHLLRRRFLEKGLKLEIHAGPSLPELELADILDSWGLDYVVNDRSTIRSMVDKNRKAEIDFLVGSIGIEYNSVYTHSNKHPNYHTYKTVSCLEKGISLIHLWDDRCMKKQVSRLRSLLVGTDKSLGARECRITYKGNFKSFFDENHLDGNTAYKFAIGLEYKGELVCCMSLRHHKEGLEIARFATQLNLRVHSGFSRIMKYVKQKAKELGYSSIITYADIDWTPDYKKCVYYKYGMTYEGETPPKLYYTKGSTIYSRQKFMKHKLKTLFPDDYDDNLTANDILQKNGIFSLYKTGNHRFIFTID